MTNLPNYYCTPYDAPSSVLRADRLYWALSHTESECSRDWGNNYQHDYDHDNQEHVGTIERYAARLRRAVNNPQDYDDDSMLLEFDRGCLAAYEGWLANNRLIQALDNYQPEE